MTAKKPPVVMIHGAFTGPWVWGGFTGKFKSAGYKVHTPCLRHHENKKPPASHMDPGSLVKMGSDNSNVGAGSINRSESIDMTMAALIAQVLPNGNMVIAGHQQVRVNNELRDLAISGIVRSQDITPKNTVDLAQIAEARVSYGGLGTVSDVQQPRYGSQLFDIIMPW